ncbi:MULTISPECIES: hypothetical protein [Marinovum]|uniref:hypothetical protein n=1 Tax=Marinovum TaxID=367771 RepID=UPI00237AB761|nr:MULTISPECIES: hypothetical protein [Marinovum]MDD9745591.1 hypothetical protein [Marinovum sp. PR37]
MTLLHRLALCLALLLPIAAPAQNAQAFFDNYLAMRARLDTLVKNRDFAEVMPVFGDQTDPAELEALERRVREIYPRDFENVALIRRQDMDHGFRQELIAYWEGTQYIYIYIVLHDRDDGIVALVFNFNSEFDELNAKF